MYIFRDRPEGCHS